MKNGIFKLDWENIIDALITAAVMAVVVAAVSLVSTPGFDLFSADWVGIGRNMLNLAVIAAVVSIGRDLLTTNKGSLLGVGPT